jgi:hypothetical protein
MAPLWLLQKCRMMLQRLLDLTHPDGAIPLLNDSVLGFAPEPVELLSYARELFGCKRSPRERAREDDGYCAFSDSRCFLLIDGGPLGPEFLPNHGHADNLSFELSVDGRRVIVDSGVSGFRADEMRAYCRGTAAHNTVVVDSKDQSEMWRSFRVGKRARPLEPKVKDRGGLSSFIGGHKGYRRLVSGVTHRRTLLHVPNEFFVIIDAIEGSGRHRMESHIHLAPDLTAVRSDGRVVVEDGSSPVLQLIPFDCGSPAIGFSRYFPNFGTRCENQEIVYEFEKEAPCCFGYFLVPGNVRASASCEFEDGTATCSFEREGEQQWVIRGCEDGFVLRRSRE